jgi:hypothetical protein
MGPTLKPEPCQRLKPLFTKKFPAKPDSVAAAAMRERCSDETLRRRPSATAAAESAAWGGPARAPRDLRPAFHF